MTDIDPITGVSIPLAGDGLDSAGVERMQAGAPVEGKAFAKPDDGSIDWTEKLDGDMKAVLDAMSDLRPQPIEVLTPDEARRQPTAADGANEILRKTKLDRVDDLKIATKDFIIPGPAGDLQARLYGPEVKHKDDAKPLPVVLYIHGGGWVIADLNTYDASPRAIARFAHCIVVSVHYRQAPEAPFPAAHDDCFAAWKWVVQNAAHFGGDPEKIAIVGESAGGNMACATSIRARDEGVQSPLAQVLVYPVAQNDLTTESYTKFAHAKPLNKPMIEWFVKHYLGGPDGTADPRINLVAANLAGLPTTSILNAEIDPLCDDGEKLETALKAAGVETHRHVYSGVTHEFFGMGLVVKKAALAEQTCAHTLKKAFGTAILPF